MNNKDFNLLLKSIDQARKIYRKLTMKSKKKVQRGHRLWCMAYLGRPCACKKDPFTANLDNYINQ